MKINKQRIATLGLGYLGNHLVNKVINWGVDPLIALSSNGRIGGIEGFLLTWALILTISFVACYLTLLFYDWSKKDWLGIEAAKELKDELEGGRFKRLIASALRRGDKFAVVALSIFTDAFVVVAYMRHGANQYNGMTKRDWKIFLVSLLISNFTETLMLYGGAEIIKRIWGAIL